VLETLRRGVRRADVFMGVGLNSAEHNPPISHILAPTSQYHIQLVKEHLSDKEKVHVAHEFGKWITTNGLRELLETFSIFLFEIYSAAYLIHRHEGTIPVPPPRTPTQFERLGIGDQMEQLSALVTVPNNDIRIIRSLNRARNCYVHRQGRIGQPEIDGDTRSFDLLWTALQMEVREPNGNIIPEEEMFGKVIEHGGAVKLRVVERNKSFALGDELVVEKRDMKEICLCLLTIGERLFNETVGLAQIAKILQERVDSNMNDPKPV